MKASPCTGWQALVGTTGSWEQDEWKGRHVGILFSLPVNKVHMQNPQGRSSVITPSPSEALDQSCWLLQCAGDSRVAQRARDNQEGRREGEEGRGGGKTLLSLGSKGGAAHQGPDRWIVVTDSSM